MASAYYRPPDVASRPIEPNFLEAYPRHQRKRVSMAPNPVTHSATTSTTANRQNMVEAVCRTLNRALDQAAGGAGEREAHNSALAQFNKLMQDATEARTEHATLVDRLCKFYTVKMAAPDSNRFLQQRVDELEQRLRESERDLKEAKQSKGTSIAFGAIGVAIGAAYSDSYRVSLELPSERKSGG